MLSSMTGFGSGSATVGSESVTVELKSVNHKFLEVKVRAPRELAALEPVVQRLLKDRLARGAVDVTVRRALRTTTGAVPTVDLALAQEYRRAFGEVARALGLPDDLTLRDVALQPGIIRLEEPQVSLGDAGPALEQALGGALEALKAMRRLEGAALEKDLLARLGLVQGLVTELIALAPAAVDEYRARLQDRLKELLQGAAVDPQRLAQEVALFAERTDVAEELTRLASHLEQFRALVALAEPSGRKMDFLVQELHREVNTTGSKSQHAGISSRVLQLKAELERIREQVQNVE
jgi:uncharacterized protein (TIGR00255 family)